MRLFHFHLNDAGRLRFLLSLSDSGFRGKSSALPDDVNGIHPLCVRNHDRLGNAGLFGRR
jgi:hypothetical protein